MLFWDWPCLIRLLNELDVDATRKRVWPLNGRRFDAPKATFALLSGTSLLDQVEGCIGACAAPLTVSRRQSARAYLVDDDCAQAALDERHRGKSGGCLVVAYYFFREPIFEVDSWAFRRVSTSAEMSANVTPSNRLRINSRASLSVSFRVLLTAPTTRHC